MAAGFAVLCLCLAMPAGAEERPGASAGRLDLGIAAPVPPTADLLNRGKLGAFYQQLSYPDRMLLLNRCAQVLSEPGVYSEELVAICRLLARM
jgi:hypothetical protein